jgi:hypothetical protein
LIPDKADLFDPANRANLFLIFKLGFDILLASRMLQVPYEQSESGSEANRENFDFYSYYDIGSIL